MALTRELLEGLSALRHRDGAPLIRLYGPGPRDSGRGGTVAFNVLDRDGRCVPFGLVEDRANAAGVHMRGGCFCNPGTAEAAFRFDAAQMSRCLDSLGDGFTIPRLQQCLGPDVAAGALRASLGLANNQRDIRRVLDIVASFAI